MSRSTMLFTTTLLASALALAPQAALADASGVVTEILGRPYPVRDAIAYRERDEIIVLVSSMPFDAIDFADDGKLDSRDLIRHRSAHELITTAFAFKPQGYFRRWDGEDFEEGVNPVGGWKLSAIDDGRIAGTFDYAATNVTFDLPIRDPVTAPVAGEALAADSEPVRALEAYFDAQRHGDLDAALALSMPPEDRAGIDAEQRDRFAAAMKPSPMRVDRIEFRDGRTAGRVAQIHYAVWGKIWRGEVRRARMVQIDGGWIVANEIAD